MLFVVEEALALCLKLGIKEEKQYRDDFIRGEQCLRDLQNAQVMITNTQAIPYIKIIVSSMMFSCCIFLETCASQTSEHAQGNRGLEVRIGD